MKRFLITVLSFGMILILSGCKISEMLRKEMVYRKTLSLVDIAPEYDVGGNSLKTYTGSLTVV